MKRCFYEIIKGFQDYLGVSRQFSDMEIRQKRRFEFYIT
ncbi:hypothetical protein CKA32_001030 [Geitlerinema sp. FC II]|nr:hypothetical protein CKA32_001030 [Geitlerinema sp. FC II]